MNDIFTTYVELPLTVHGMVVPTPEGDWRIFINSASTPAQQRETFDHEVRHILLGHYRQQWRPLRAIEAEANDATLLAAQIKTAAAQGVPAPPLLAPRAPIHVSEHAPPARALTPPRQAPPCTPAWYGEEHHRLRRAALTNMHY